MRLTRVLGSTLISSQSQYVAGLKLLAMYSKRPALTLEQCSGTALSEHDERWQAGRPCNLSPDDQLCALCSHKVNKKEKSGEDRPLSPR